jgi:hypothetical protein
MQLVPRIKVVALALVLAGCATSPSPSPNATPAPTTPPSSSPTPQVVPSGTPACTTAHVRIEAGWEGATGSLAGVVVVTNTGSSACVLAGPPHAQLRADGAAIDVTITTYRSLQVDQPQDAPPVLLEPGGQAQASLNWSNWCGAQLGKIDVLVTLPDGSGPVQASDLGPGQVAGLAPRCDAPDAGSTLGVFPFAPTS